MTENRKGWYGYATFGYSDPDLENKIKKAALEKIKAFDDRKGPAWSEDTYAIADIMTEFVYDILNQTRK